MAVIPERPDSSEMGSVLRDKSGGDRDFTMAFQPIVDTDRGVIYAYEALLRGADGAAAEALLQRVSIPNRYRFDQHCRITAIRMAVELGLDTRLSINFLPNALQTPDNYLSTTMAVASRFGLAPERLIFELTEHEPLRNPAFLDQLRRGYHQHGFATAIDDFGAGFAGLQLLADFQPDIIKLDRRLVTGIAQDRTRRVIVRAMVRAAVDLSCRIVAEGVESRSDLETISSLGVTLCQGFLFGQPAVGRLPKLQLLA